MGVLHPILPQKRPSSDCLLLLAEMESKFFFFNDQQAKVRGDGD